MHIHNPVNGEKRGYGFVDFVDEQSTKKALGRIKYKYFFILEKEGKGDYLNHLQIFLKLI